MLKSNPLRRSWREAIEKIESEPGCRVCGATDFIDVAHVSGRKYDSVNYGPRGGKYLFVRPESVVPLCGAFGANFCHGQFDAHALNLLPYLTIPEIKDAIRCVGKGRARRRLTGGAA